MAAKKKAPARKKSPIKKRAVKKAAAKKSSVKKTAAKKTAAKKSSVKRPARKKAAVKKKSPVKRRALKKAPVKKSAVKKTASKKPTAKKTGTKKAAVKKSPVKRYSNLASFPSAQISSVEIPATTNVLVQELPTKVALPTVVTEEKEGKRKLGAFFAVGLVVVAGLLFVSIKGSDNSSEVPSTEVSAEPTAEEPQATQLGAPQNVYADYTPTGGKVTWEAPTTADQVSNYLVQASFKGGDFSTIATVDPDTFTFEVMKVDTPGFTAFRVVALYPEATEIISDISELKGQYEPQP